jgi:signal transduction histidine kinase/FixJ family two-component response regulator
MATILVIEDRPLDRTLLTGILRTQGHEIIEASDGHETFDTMAQIGPDVVISDILMPTVDGSGFVRRMRGIPALAATPVIFYTAAYHEREARALAHQCGVVDILMKPSTPDMIRATVDAALDSRTRLPIAPLDHADVDREHLHLVSSTLAARIDRFDAEKERMKAVFEVAEQVAAQRDPRALIYKLCAEARHVTLAQHAVIGLLAEDGSTRETLYTTGLDAATAVAMTPPSVDGALLTAVVRQRRAVRTRNPDGRPEVLGLPADHPAVSSLLNVPLASSSRVYGWLSLRNKLGTDEFTDVDERVALTLGAHAGTAYENVRLFDDLQRHVITLERELDRTSVRVSEEERGQLSRTLHDEIGQVLASLKIDMRWLAARLPRGTRSSRTDLADKADSILQRLDQALESVRTIASELRPAALDRLGLVGAIEWQAEEFERRSGIRCRVDSRIDEIDLKPRRVTAVFKIVQEALTNVLQHSRATRATVTLRRSLKSLTVSVVDNGRGISDRDLANGGSLGLIGMRERGALLGGHLDVRRRRPTGTIVRLTVPLTSKRASRGRA